MDEGLLKSPKPHPDFRFVTYNTFVRVSPAQKLRQKSELVFRFLYVITKIYY